MKKFLLLPAALLAFSAFAQDANSPVGDPSNYVLKIACSDGYPSDLQSEFYYYLQPLDDNNNLNTKYSTRGLPPIVLKGYTDEKLKSAKYTYSITYYPNGYSVDATDGVANQDNSYVVFIGENDNPINLAVCARWPEGKTFVEWLHNFSNVVLVDANLYGYAFISGNELTAPFTYMNAWDAGEGYAGTAIETGKRYTAADTNNANINGQFLKGNNSKSTSLVDIDVTEFKGKGEGVYKITYDCTDGAMKIAPISETFELYVDGLTTLVAPFDLEIPSELKAYTLNYNEEDGNLEATKVSSVIPANTPVIVKSNTSGDFTFNIASTAEKFQPIALEAPNAGKAYLPDSRTDGNVLVGVNHPHWLESYPGSNRRYTLKGSAFAISKPDKNYNTPITPQYTCFVELAEGLSTYPDNLEIVFPQEEEPAEPAEAIYIHFTDEDGSYLSTHEDVLVLKEQSVEGEENGEDTEADGVESTPNESPRLAFVKRRVDEAGTLVYELELLPVEEESYFVLSASDFTNQVSLLSTSNDSWSGFEGTVYHLNGENLEEIDPTTAETITPVNLEPGNYTVTLSTAADGTPVGISLSDNTETGISAAEVVKAESDVMYNIFGMPVDKSYKGIVIKNGKKYILR